MRLTLSRIHLLPTLPPRFWAAFFCIVFCLGACAGGPPKLPYPAFVQVDELLDTFLASFPGVRAKQLAGDPRTRRSSNRIDLPRNWAGTSGGSPGRSTEIFVVAGKLTVADIELGPGGYAFFPPGSLGFNLRAEEGARILYFVNDSNTTAVIRAPIIIDSELLDWVGTATPGIETRELRNDPGSGAKTWLQRVSPDAALSWESSTVAREGYLLSGSLEYSECVNGEIAAWEYSTGGYFWRPANTMHGGPDSRALTESIWLMREASKGELATWPACVAAKSDRSPEDPGY